MNKWIKGIPNLFKRVWGDQRGITGLETAIVLIAFVVVAAVFAFAVITTGLFGSEKASATATAGLGEASTSLTPKGAVIAQANQGKDSVATVKFKLTNSGNEPVGLAGADTLLTYSDPNNLATLVRSADLTGSAETSPWWWSEWKLGTGDSLDSGEVVEITVGLFTATDSTETVFEGGTFLAADTALTVSVGGGPAFAVNDTIYIDKEQLTVTAQVGDLLTVTRGVNNTTAADHVDLSKIYDVLSRLTTDVGVNTSFKVELIPATGAPFTVTRISPVEMTVIMDLR